ncbi:MAG: ROK family protein [Saprospiraceae bacterium]|nr:ROK family protein [Pyrinomonadaceae bacterium]
MIEVIAGIDIGGTKIAIALEKLNGERIAVRRLPTGVENGPYSIIETVLRTIDEMLAETGARLVSIGICCPSPLDVENGLIMSPSNLMDWENFPIVKLFQDRFGVAVVLENDANAAALGEHVYGAGSGYRNIVYVTVSTGIGGGIIINGEIYHGVNTAAGEMGHTIVQPDGTRCNCGSVGCLETICSGTHIARRTRERLAFGEPSLINDLAESGEVTAEMIVEAVRQKDRVAVEIWEETCHFLAIGIGNIITLLAPEAVVIGGGIASAGGLLFMPLRRLVPQFVSMLPAEKINIMPAELGSESGVCGALVLAKRAYSKTYQYAA